VVCGIEYRFRDGELVNCYENKERIVQVDKLKVFIPTSQPKISQEQARGRQKNARHGCKLVVWLITQPTYVGRNPLPPLYP
jgi:hypothetical protein